MRSSLLSAVLAVAAGPAATAGPLGLVGRANTPPPYPAPYGYTPRGPLPPQAHPRIAALAMPGGIWTGGYYAPPPGTSRLSKVAPRAVAASLVVMAYFGKEFYPIGYGTEVTIRLTHVLANGTPVPGLPRDTLIWLASPWGMRVVDRVRERRGGPVIGGR